MFLVRERHVTESIGEYPAIGPYLALFSHAGPFAEGEQLRRTAWSRSRSGPRPEEIISEKDPGPTSPAPTRRAKAAEHGRLEATDTVGGEHGPRTQKRHHLEMRTRDTEDSGLARKRVCLIDN